MSTSCRFSLMLSAAMTPNICARPCSIQATSLNRITPSTRMCRNGYITWIEEVLAVDDAELRNLRHPWLSIEQPYAGHNPFECGPVISELQFGRNSEKISQQSIWP